MLTRILASTAIMLALAAPSWAQQSSDDLQQQRAEQRQQTRQQDTDERPMNQLSMAKADTIQGSAVRNRQGDAIGDVEEVVVDVAKGQVAYAIIGVGGFLGVGEKSVAVPWNRLQPADQPQSFVLNVDRQTLQAAPAVDTDNLAQLEDAQSRQRISQFWQQAESQQAQTPEREGGERPQE